MSAFSTLMSIQAAESSEHAANEARKAKDAAESRIDAQAKFVVVPVAKFETISNGWFSSKTKFIGEGKRMSIKNTDVARIEERVDDFGNKFATLILEERGYTEDDDGDTLTRLNLSLALEDATALINGHAKLS